MASRRYFDGAQVEIGSLPIEGAAVQTITLYRVESSASVYSPTVSRQASNVIALALVASTAQVFLPTVVQASGVQTVTLNRVESTAQVFSPTVRQVSGGDTSDILDHGIKRLRDEEENIAAQLLKNKNQKLARKKQKKTDWKKFISDRVNGVEAAVEVKEPTAATVSVDLAKLAEEYRKQVRADISAIIEARAAEIQAIAEYQEQRRLALEEAARLEALRIAEEQRIAALIAEEERRIAAIKAEEERKKNIKIRKFRALLLLATMDD